MQDSKFQTRKDCFRNLDRVTYCRTQNSAGHTARGKMPVGMAEETQEYNICGYSLFSILSLVGCGFVGHLLCCSVTISASPGSSS